MPGDSARRRLSDLLQHPLLLGSLHVRTEFFMPRCDITFDESTEEILKRPPWTRGDFRGVLNLGRCVALSDAPLPVRKRNLPRLWCVQKANTPYESLETKKLRSHFLRSFMPRCDITFDESSVPLGQGGLQGGVRSWLSGRPKPVTTTS